MVEESLIHSEEAEKTCPILAAFSSGKSDQASSGKFWAVRCKHDGCGWWDSKRNCCAVVALSEHIGDLMASGILPRV